MLASDVANTQFVGAYNPDSVLHVEFYNNAVPMPAESEKQGRPIFQDVIYIRIHTPGNQLSVIDRPMYPQDKSRFPLHWAQFQNTQGSGEQVAGTPVSQWAALSKAQAEGLRAMKFMTVESIANASDQQIMALGSTGAGGMAPFALREQAKAFLSSATDTALPQRLAAENQHLREQNQAISSEVDELRKLVLQLAENQKAKPGRKPKETADE